MNLVYEKTPESVFYKAVTLAEEKWGGVNIQEYTATESICLEGIQGMRCTPLITTVPYCVQTLV